ncbi:CoA-binding protein [Falsiroseomonas tokyonensis]|uniref:CoA-binding protein n=1 Tax=Falsiroseomonas tokyonensis TaxID=430521 RepID=A0ABV7BS95_9PROT|nr:CoA-binding protein [Falsiroseomonas tokyonensis]MBU8537542.1 CoA-binding protein [Falsiroseomonas tokyonensis]
MNPSFLHAPPRRVVIINPTGRYASAQVAAMRAAGTALIAGIAPGRGGTTLDGLPLLDDLSQLDAPADAAVLYTPPEGVLDAVRACIAGRIPLIVAAAEYVPVHDSLKAAQEARAAGSWLIGPNTLGLCIPGQTLLGSIAPEFCTPGHIALLCRSGTLTLALARLLTEAGLGQSAVIHMGGDLVIGRNPHEYLAPLAADPNTRAILLCGELGGDKEYALAEALPTLNKPLIALIMGRHAPAGTRMGHAGALAGADRETAHAKLDALRQAGAIAVERPEQAVAALAEL